MTQERKREREIDTQKSERKNKRERGPIERDKDRIRGYVVDTQKNGREGGCVGGWVRERERGERERNKE